MYLARAVLPQLIQIAHFAQIITIGKAQLSKHVLMIVELVIILMVHTV